MIPGHHHHVDPGAATPPHGIGNVGANRVDEPDQTENFEGRDLGALRRYRSLYVTMGHGKHPVAPGGEAVELLLYAVQVERGLAFRSPAMVRQNGRTVSTAPLTATRTASSSRYQTAAYRCSDSKGISATMGASARIAPGSSPSL